MAECECCGQPLADPAPDEAPTRRAPTYLEEARRVYMQIAEGRGVPWKVAEALWRAGQAESGLEAGSDAE